MYLFDAPYVNRPQWYVCRYKDEGVVGSGMHCKDKIPKFRNKYSQKRKIGVLSPSFHIHASVRDLYIPTMGLPVLLQEICRPILDYINRSQTHECGNLGWGRAIPRKGIHKWDFRCSVWLSWLGATGRRFCHKTQKGRPSPQKLNNTFFSE